MITLRKIPLSESEMRQLEKAMRMVSIKRTRSPDFTSAIMNIGSDKIFIGFDGKQDLRFARLRTSFEKFLPEIVICIPKDEIKQEYKLRYSLLSTVVLGSFSILFILIIVSAILGNTSYENVAIPMIFLGGFLLLTMFELRIVNWKIKKARTFLP